MVAFPPCEISIPQTVGRVLAYPLLGAEDALPAADDEAAAVPEVRRPEGPPGPQRRHAHRAAPRPHLLHADRAPMDGVAWSTLTPQSGA